MTVKEWLKSNNIKFSRLGVRYYSVPNFGSIYWVKDFTNGKVYSANGLNLTENQMSLIPKDVDYLVYEFAGVFCYAKFKNYDPQPIEFNVLRHVGESSAKFDEKYWPLGICSEHNLLHGTGHIEEYVRKAKFYGYKGLGYLGVKTLSGTYEFQTLCLEHGIKPIFMYDTGEDYFLIVKNERGWKKLLDINYTISTGSLAYQIKDSDGLSVLFKYNANPKIIEEFEKGGRDYLYEFPTHLPHDQENISENIKFVSKKKVVITNRAMTVEAGESFFTDIVSSISKESVIVNERARHLQTFEEQRSEFKKWFSKSDGVNFQFELYMKSALRNLQHIFNSANFKIEKGRFLPVFDKNKDAKKEFKKECLKGLVKRGFAKDKKYIERLRMEMKVISDAGFSDYFLINADIVRHAKNIGSLVGVARGSAGGCLVAYVMGITELDPLKYGLIFERFLNPARVASGLPDIDIDLESRFRDEVKLYCENKYSAVCSIGTIGTLSLKAAVKDIFRGKLSFTELNDLTNSFDVEKSDVAHLIEETAVNGKMRELARAYPDHFYALIRLINSKRQKGVHASAVVIFPDGGNSYEHIPVIDHDGLSASEWEGEELDSLGYLKNDLLGIKQLDKFSDIISLVKKYHEIDIELNETPLNDSKTYDLFSKGMNIDVFQFGSTGLRGYTKQLKPKNIEDLIAANALFRPSTIELGLHEEYIKRKDGKDFEYDWGMEDITKTTYGILIYQESQMAAFQKVGQLTLSEADTLRKVMKKKDPELLAPFKKKFFKNGAYQGAKKEQLKDLWEKMLSTGSYSFNRSHSTAYAIQGYWCQYLKANYPLEFYTVAMRWADNNKIPSIISELKHVAPKIKVQTCSINQSNKEVTTDGQKIYLGFNRVKGMGDAAIDEIISTRGKVGGKFHTFTHFLQVVEKRKVNKSKVKCLIYSGAFDELEDVNEKSERRYILESYYALIKEKGEIEERDSVDFQIKEAELTGVGSIDFEKMVEEKMGRSYSRYYKNIDEFHSSLMPKKRSHYKVVTIAGKVIFVDEKKTKKGDPFVKVVIENEGKRATIFVWKEQCENENLVDRIKKKSIYAFHGILNNFGGGDNVLNSYDEFEFEKLI